jgi:hypothetical protein
VEPTPENHVQVRDRRLILQRVRDVEWGLKFGQERMFFFLSISGKVSVGNASDTGAKVKFEASEYL